MPSGSRQVLRRHLIACFACRRRLHMAIGDVVAIGTGVAVRRSEDVCAFLEPREIRC
jgi:hypothetical protein